jgi:hypothetical protein
MATKKIDWIGVEKDFRPGIMVLREIGEKYGCTEGAVRKKAKKEGWIRNLNRQIETKAEELVRLSYRAENAEATELEIINANAANSANIQLRERGDVTKARTTAMKLLEELNEQIDDKESYERLGEILRNPDQYGSDKLNDTYLKTISFSGRVDSTKKLSEALKVLIELERKVYKIDADTSDDGVEAFLRKLRNVGI